MLFCRIVILAGLLLPCADLAFARMCSEVFQNPRITHIDPFMDWVGGRKAVDQLRERLSPSLAQVLDTERPSMERVFAQRELHRVFNEIARESRDVLSQAGINFSERTVVEDLGQGPPQRWVSYVIEPSRAGHWANNLASSLQRRFGQELVVDPISLAMGGGIGFFADGAIHVLPAALVRQRPGGVLFHEIMHAIYEVRRQEDRFGPEPVNIRFVSEAGLDLLVREAAGYRHFMSFEEVTAWAATLQMHAQALLRADGLIFSDQFIPDSFLSGLKRNIALAEAAHFVASEGLRTLSEGGRQDIRYHRVEIRLRPTSDMAIDIHLPLRLHSIRYVSWGQVSPEMRTSIESYARLQLERAQTMAEFTLQYFAGYEALPIHELVLRASRFRKEQRRYLRSLL